ncbi:hypothetical protein [Actinoplanes sp. NPDC051411]|uniref:hypothetical protein n=1 Tax=Actinoplanes sp. NPDC051411 TaxID=3155522 RepID=UPI003441C501
MPPVDQIVDTAYDVTTQLFGPDSGIPWWAWGLVVLILFWKVLLPERKTAADRDAAMVAAMTGEGGGKKGKKKKKK